MRTKASFHLHRCWAVTSPATLLRTESHWQVSLLHYSEDFWDINNRGHLSRRWHWFRVNVIISCITVVAAVQWQLPDVNRGSLWQNLCYYLYRTVTKVVFNHPTQNLNIYTLRFLLESSVFRVIITKALELAKVVVVVGKSFLLLNSWALLMQT